jgi:hypothetical protein
MELRIDQEFKDIIPALSEDEFITLEQNILSEGCTEAIKTWNDVIIDGHHRYAICTKHGLPFKTQEMQFDSRLDVEIWVIRNQKGRRNVSIYVMVGLGLKLEERLKQKGLENNITNSFEKLVDKEAEPSQNSAKSLTKNSPVDTREEIASFANTSHDTVSKVKEIKQSAPKEVKDELENKINSGDLSINQVHKAVKSVKNNDQAGEILKKAIEKTESSPKLTLENAVREAKSEIEIVQKEKKKDDALTSDTKPSTKKSVFNFTNDNIEWAKWTWNPVTGCKFGCPYCYAKDIANRFYPNKFEPTFHEDRLDAPVNTKVPTEATTDIGYKNVFVCSMADLFGDWIPDEWIEKVLNAVR